MSCNIVLDYVEFTKKNFEIYTKKIMGKYYDKELFNKYMDVYVGVRYYNQFVPVRTMLEANLNHYLNDVFSKNNNKTSRFILELFKMYYYLDDVKKFDFAKDLEKFAIEVDDIREKKLGMFDKDFVKNFIELLLDNRKRINLYIDKFDSKDFSLDVNLVLDKDVFNVDIIHNITIPKLYSNYAINKVWNSSVISENSLQICYYLLNQQILKDAIDGNFSKKYIVPFRVSLFSKKDKIKRVLDIMNNNLSKDLISLKINYENFINYKDDIYTLIKDGYQFSVVLDDTFIKSRRDVNVLDIFQYIIIVDDRYKNDWLVGKKNIIYI